MSKKQKRVAVNIRLYELFAYQKRKEDGSATFSKEQLESVIAVLEDALKDDGICKLEVC